MAGIRTQREIFKATETQGPHTIKLRRVELFEKIVPEINFIFKKVIMLQFVTR